MYIIINKKLKVLKNSFGVLSWLHQRKVDIFFLFQMSPRAT